MMNILIYIPELRPENGGVFQYTFGVLNNIKDIKDVKYYIFTETVFDELKTFAEENSQFIILPSLECTLSNSKKRIKHKYKRVSNKLLNYLDLNFRFNAYPHIEKIINKYKIDIIYSPTQNIPESSIPMIVTTHDLQQFHYPHYFSLKERIERAVNFKHSNKNASRIIVSYNHIKNDIIKYYNRKPKDINVLLLEMNNLWFNTLSEKDIIDISKYKLPEVFLLYPAATWEHKNHIGLIEAISKLKNEGLSVSVVCTGNKTEHFSKISKELKKNKVENLFFFLGIVDYKTLFSLYNKCTAVVIPTTYEAGSFPLIECIFMNIPVTCSDVTSLPETIGNSEYVFNPFDTEDIADKISRIMTDVSFRKTNKIFLKTRQQRLKNTNFKNKFEDILKEIITENK